MTQKEHIIYIFLVVFSTLFFVDRYMIYGVILLLGSFFFISGKTWTIYKNSMLKVFLFIVALIIIAVLLHLFSRYSSLFSVSVAIKEVSRVIIYIFLMEIICKMEINFSVYKKVWRIILFFVIGVAIIQFTKVFDIDSVLKRIYGDSLQFRNSASMELTSFRAGSVFVNPNIFACFLVAALGSYFFVLQYQKESLILKIITFGSFIIGFVLSGSRTGMLLGSLVIVTYILFSSKENMNLLVRKIICFIVGAILIGIFAVVVFDTDQIILSDLRMFKVQEGTGNSLNTKIGILGNLLSEMNIINYAMGYGPFNYSASPNLLVDFDLGYFITYFGIFGLVAYFFILYAIYMWGNRKIYGRRYLNIMFLLVMIVFGITAGVYFNFRIFSIYILMFMPALYYNDKKIA